LVALHGADIVHGGIAADKIVVGEESPRDTRGRRDRHLRRAQRQLSGAGGDQRLRAGLPADVCALSCVAFKCLSGRTPFDQHWLYEIALAHLERAAPRLAEAVEGAPPSWAAVVDAGLANDLSNGRPPTLWPPRSPVRSVRISGELTYIRAVGLDPLEQCGRNPRRALVVETATLVEPMAQQHELCRAFLSLAPTR
jgi:hypothetical protein